MPPVEPEKRSKILEIIAQREIEAIQKNKILTYFPDSGPFRRELYQKHIEFFDAGSRYKERLFMAANRCLGPWSAIQTERGERRIVELLGETGFDVRSWDGGSRCTKRAGSVFLKGIEPAFRLHLDNGEVFDCSGKHQVLTTAGWVQIDQLIRRADGQRLLREGEDSLASCGTENRQGGQQPRRESDSVPELLPSKGGAPERALGFQHQDVAEPRFERTNAYRDCDLPSNLDDPILIADLCVGFQDPTSDIDALWPISLRQEFELSQPGSCLRISSAEGSPDRSSRTGRVDQEFEPFSFLLRPSHAPLVGGNCIVSIVPLGLQPILDFSVAESHNYEIGGVIHHNCGKSDSGAFESTCHATGIYPAWWTGRRFDKPTEGWACGTTGETTRDIVQAKLVGPVGALGTGFIPAHLITKTTSRRGGIADALESIVVKHVSGKHSLIGLKSYQQGRESFEGTSKDYIWFDEEPPQDVYTEGLYRTVTTKGVVFTTFTPLQGMSDVVRGFKEPETEESEQFKWYVQAGWDDVPHIDEEEKKAVIATTPPYQIEARTKGEPALGSGAIYPIPERDITVPNEPIPMSWPRCFAMDVGWNRTAVLWAARNPATSQVVVYDEYYQGMGEPASHVVGINARGPWIPGVIDPASKGRSQIDGQQLLTLYRKLGLQLSTADNTVEAGIMEVWNMFVSGQLKVQARCFNFFSEFRQYHRDDKGRGKIVKKYDHLCDCLRYLCTSGLYVMKLRPLPQPKRIESYKDHGGRGWMI